MSPIFTPDFTKVDASFPMYEKGKYRLKVTKATPFCKLSQPDKETGVKTEQKGLYYGLEMVGKFDDSGNLDQTQAGKPVSRYTVYIHTEGGMQFAKPFLMASNGYNVKNEENEANAQLFQAGDWSFSGEVDDAAENIELGKSWAGNVGHLVDAFLGVDIGKNADGTPRENQTFTGWTPVK